MPATIDILYDRRSIECYRLLALTRRGAAILEWSSAPLSVIRLAGTVNELSAHLINHTSLNTTDFHAFFGHTCSYDKGHMVWRVLLFIVGLTLIEYSDML